MTVFSGKSSVRPVRPREYLGRDGIRPPGFPANPAPESHPRWVGLGRFFREFLGHRLEQWPDGGGLIEVQEGVVPARQAGGDVVPVLLVLWAVDDANGPVAASLR